MGISERRERQRDALRTRILDAARELFISDGVEAVTMRKIAEAIEYSPTAIYSYFKDKDTLLEALCATDFLSLAEAFAASRDIADPIERLRSIAAAYVEFAVVFPRHYQFMFMTPTSCEHEHELEKGNPEEDAYAVLLHTAQEAIDGGLLRESLVDAELVAQVLWSAIHGVVALHVAKGNDPWVDWRPLRVTTDTAVDALLYGLMRQR